MDTICMNVDPQDWSPYGNILHVKYGDHGAE